MPHPRMGINVHQAGEPALRLAASLGVSVVRVDAVWPDLQPTPDHWTWGWLDELYATCVTLGLQVYCSLSQTPGWLGLNRGDLPPLYDWQRFCTEFAQHYAGRMTFIGCWNEYGGSPQDYVNRLLRPMATSFRAVDARYRIVGPDLRTMDRWAEWLKTCLELGGDCLDIISAHNYKNTGVEVWKALTQSRRRWEFWKDPSVVEVIKSSGHAQKPIWITETGWNTSKVSEARQANYIQELLERFETNNQIERLFFYQLIDEEPPVLWGLFHQDSSAKPCVSVIQSYTLLVG